MTRGINAAIWVLSAILAITLLSGLGFYTVADVSFNQDAEETSRILDVLNDPQGSAASGSGVVESFSVGALDGLQVFWIAISDTEEVIKLFLPFPAIASVVGVLAQVAMGLTMVQGMRGVIFE